VQDRRGWTLVKTLIITVLVPGSVTVLVPYGLLSPGGELRMRSWGLAGVPAVAVGAVIYLWCAWNFAVRGLGTPLIIDPPKVLVAAGLYRYVRNPMYVAVVLAVGGEAVLFRSSRLLSYAILLWTVFHLFVVLYEEPNLKKKFGAPYEEYRKTVPRWIPKLRAGRP
jgi:protein-S-isoprenylcysteine O-methyltransferase Ste14